MGGDILGFLLKCKEEYGDVVQLELGGYETFLINDPAMIEQVLVADARNFIKHTFFWRHVRKIFGSGLLTSEGDFWLRQRRLAQPAFHRERIAAYATTMTENTERALSEWRDGDERELLREFLDLTLRIVAKFLFDADVSRDVEEVGRAVDTSMREVAARFRRPFPISDIIPVPGNLRYRRAVRRLDRLVERFIAEHRRGERSRPDLLSMLMEARDEDGSALSDKQLRDESITLLLAGHETTAISLAWTWFLLAQNPDVAEKLGAELDNVLGDRSPTIDDVARLPYTEAVITESMRIYPPIYALGREPIEDCVIGGYDVPAGATILMPQWVVHRDARWFDDPHECRPERWLDGLAQRLPRFAYFPFGGGPRGCIANRLAMIEMVLLLGVMAKRFRVELIGAASEIVPVATITVRPTPGVRVRLHAR
ncbi:MAG: cytochrome P450 [Gemmatimonadota bacterium]|nr:cytochrome P450 [Gemmatimonadota bacterium]